MGQIDVNKSKESAQQKLSAGETFRIFNVEGHGTMV
jgi:hypothetical protein